MKNTGQEYLREIEYLRYYLILTVVFIILCYAVAFVFPPERVERLGDEDNLFEWLTCLLFFASSVIFFLAFWKTGNKIFLVVALAMLLGAGEEISWGQRIFRWKTPEIIENINVQDEINLHNIELFNSRDFSGRWKEGLSKLTEINFLFKVFAMFCGIILPFCAYHIKFVSGITKRLTIPVPPISLGVFFLITWFIYFFLRKVVFPDISTYAFIDSIQEIFECTESFLTFILGWYFYRKPGHFSEGKDIKEVIRERG